MGRLPSAPGAFLEPARRRDPSDPGWGEVRWGVLEICSIFFVFSAPKEYPGRAYGAAPLGSDPRDRPQWCFLVTC